MRQSHCLATHFFISIKSPAYKYMQEKHTWYQHNIIERHLLLIIPRIQPVKITVIKIQRLPLLNER